jgi:hypothetical protein
MMNVEAAISEQGDLVSWEKLDNIVCQAIPRLSVEEKAAVESGMQNKVWPWFDTHDGAILFEDSTSRWFLAGRAVESYECR